MNKNSIAAIVAVLLMVGSSFAIMTMSSDDSSAAEYEEFTMTTPVDYAGNTEQITFKEMPDRVVAGCCTALNLLLYLGLGDRIVGVYYMEEEVWDQVADEWAKVKARIGDDHVLTGNISKAVLTDWEPDLVIGWVAWTDAKLGSNAGYWNALGCNVMSFRTMVDEQNLDGMKEDYTNMGKIFQVSDKTTAYMEKFTEVYTSVKGILSTSTKTIAVYDGVGNSSSADITEFWFYKTSSTFIGWLLDNMGAKVYGNGKISKATLYDTVDNIDMMFFVCYGDATYDKTMSIWTGDDVLKTAPAIVNNRVQSMKLSVAYGADPSLIDNVNALSKLLTETFKVKGISMDATSLVELGKSVNMKVTFNPVDADNQKLTWKTSDSKVVSVDAGKITGVSKGTATVTATSVDGSYTASCVVTVTDPSSNNDNKDNTMTYVAAALAVILVIVAAGAVYMYKKKA